MKSIINYIDEAKHSFQIFSEAKHSFRIFDESKHSFRIKSHLKKEEIEYKYKPISKNELIKAIKTELDNGNTNLNCIDTSNITDMINLFNNSLSNYHSSRIVLTDEQQKTLDVSKWDTSNVEKMERMFYNCEYFNGDISEWIVSNVENMDSMFFNCTWFNSDLSKWNVSGGCIVDHMFLDCKSKPTWYHKIK